MFWGAELLSPPPDDDVAVGGGTGEDDWFEEAEGEAELYDAEGMFAK